MATMDTSCSKKKIALTYFLFIYCFPQVLPERVTRLHLILSFASWTVTPTISVSSFTKSINPL